MNWPWLEQIFYLLVIIPASIYFHELGHAYYITNKLKQKAKLKWYWKQFKAAVVWTPKEPLTPSQKFDISIYGILSGLVPFLLLSGSLDLIFFYPLFFTYIIFSCKQDNKFIWEALKEKYKK